MRRRKSLGCQPADVQCVGKAANNKGYTFAADGKRYIIKLYRSKEWPEAGKLPWVYQKRKLYGIPRAELLLYEHGKCLSEQEIDGTAADEIAMDEAQEAACYKKLAELLSRTCKRVWLAYRHMQPAAAGHTSCTPPCTC